MRAGKNIYPISTDYVKNTKRILQNISSTLDIPFNVSLNLTTITNKYGTMLQ